MFSTEDRIRASYHTLVKTKAQEGVTDWKFKTLSKIYGKPVAEIKRIVKGES